MRSCAATGRSATSTASDMLRSRCRECSSRRQMPGNEAHSQQPYVCRGGSDRLRRRKNAPEPVTGGNDQDEKQERPVTSGQPISQLTESQKEIGKVWSSGTR